MKTTCTRTSKRAIARATAARRGWAWGNPPRTETCVSADVPPKKLAVLTTIETIAYAATKGSVRATFEHSHDGPPFPLLATTPAAAGAPRVHLRSGRGAPRPRGALFFMGRLVEVRGHDPAGRPVSVRLARGAYGLAGDGHKKMHLLRMDTAHRRRRDVPPLHVLTNGSHYTITDRGIER